MILINEKDLLRVFHKIEALCSDSVPKNIKTSKRGRPQEYPTPLILFIWVYKKFFGVRRDTELFARLQDSIFFRDNFGKVPHRTLFSKRKINLEFVMKKHDVVMLPNLNRGSPDLEYIGDHGYKGAKKYVAQGVKIVGGGERLLIESEFNVMQEHMANRYVRNYKSIFSKLEMRATHLAHTLSKWVKLLLNLIFHRSYVSV